MRSRACSRSPGAAMPGRPTTLSRGAPGGHAAEDVGIVQRRSTKSSSLPPEYLEAWKAGYIIQVP
ncbi:hypothetical protein CENSYa_1319 [Cenarchaeum symbiosum A]|uniref:Uncharacterized protein n=1 Tax=Cenarchaeum symbiosum (strain A) TaxID=414004 RepID=A0RX75_CENSY|nr:hypothetical protein CENSYa_1319 [Cenarchaeum symbiosum A]